MTDHTLDASVIVDLNGNLRQNAAQYQNALGAMSRNGSKHLSVLQRTTARLDRTMNRLGNRWVALASGGAMVAAGRNTIKLEDRFERLGIQANRSSKEMDSLKQEIFDIANQSNIRIDMGELTGAVEEIIEKTGDLDFARNNIENLAMTISATAAEGKSIGGIAAEFQKMGIIDPKGVREALDILITQGKEGAFTLQNLAALGPRVVTAYTATGRTGLGAIREMGAALQVIRQATGNSEQAATSFEALMRVLSKADKVKALRKGGIQVFEPEQLKKGKEVLRPINELMVEIIKAAGGKGTILDSVIGDSEALRAFKAAISEFNVSGDIKSLDRFMSLQADGSNLFNDSARAANTTAAAIRSMATAGQAFADSELDSLIENIGDAIGELDHANLLQAMETAKDLAIAIGAVIVGYKGMRLAKGLAESGKRLGNGPGGALGDVASMAAPIPVFVVNNLPGAAGVGGGGKAKGGAAAPGKVGKIAKVGSLAMRTGAAGIGVAGAGALGYGLGSMINKMVEGSAFYDWVGATAARIMALGSNEAAEAVRLNGDKHSVYGGTGWANDEGKEATRVELELGAEASRLLNAKVVHKAGTDVDVSGSMGAR